MEGESATTVEEIGSLFCRRNLPDRELLLRGEECIEPPDPEAFEDVDDAFLCERGGDGGDGGDTGVLDGERPDENFMNAKSLDTSLVTLLWL